MIRALVLLPWWIEAVALIVALGISWVLVQGGMRFLKVFEAWLGRAPR